MCGGLEQGRDPTREMGSLSNRQTAIYTHIHTHRQFGVSSEPTEEEMHTGTEEDKTNTGNNCALQENKSILQYLIVFINMTNLWGAVLSNFS